MTIQAKYLISCLVLLANCNVHAICNTGCEPDESQLGGTGYFASGSAHSSQYLLPNGEVVTNSKGSTFSSDGIQKTFHQLKQEANQFVTKQKDTVNIPNALPPLHSSFGQDIGSLQSLGQISQAGPVGYPAQGYFNNLESSSHHQQVFTGAGGSQNSQAYYQTLPQTSKVTSTKKEQIIVNKKVISHGGSSTHGSGSELEEIETNQNKLDSNLNGDGIIYQPVPSYVNNVKVQSGNAHEEIETSKTNVRFPSVVVQPASQTSFSKYEQTVKHNSSSQAVPSFPVYIPNGQFTTSILNLNGYDNTHVNKQNNQRDLTTFVTSKVPNKVSAVDKLTSAQSENHYLHNENKDTYYENVGSSIDSEVNNQQQEHKFDAIPVASLGPEMPIKIKYVYDGKTLKKYEEYSSGAVKNIPISIEESENTLREIQKQTSSQVSQSYISQPVAHEKPESDGYYYPKGQPIPYPSNVQTIKKEQSQSSHLQQSITGGNVDQFSHLPLNVNSQKQYYVPSSSGYVGVLPPSSQVKYEANAQLTDEFSQLQHENPAILVGGVPQVIPAPVPVTSQHSSFSSGSSSHSSSYSGGQSGGFVYPSDSLASSQTSSDFIEKLSSLNSGSKLLNCGDCLTGVGSSNLPVKNSYGIATSFSSSSSNINGKKSENRHASVSVNDNGKVDTYNVKS